MTSWFQLAVLTELNLVLVPGCNGLHFPSTQRQTEGESSSTGGCSTCLLFTESQGLLLPFNCGFTLGSPPPYKHAFQPISCNDNIYFAAGGMSAQSELRMRRLGFPHPEGREREVLFHSAASCSLQMRVVPRRRRAAPQPFVIASHPSHDRWLCGTFVSSLFFFFAVVSLNAGVRGTFLRAGGDVLFVQIRIKCVSDRVLYQSSCHSHSVGGGQRIGLNIWLAGCFCCLRLNASRLSLITPITRFLYVLLCQASVILCLFR